VTTAGPGTQWGKPFERRAGDAEEHGTMEQMEIMAQPRQRRFKRDNNRLRRQGRIPSVIYGEKAAPASIAVDEHQMEMILRGASRSSAVFRVTVDDGRDTEQTLLRAVDRHPVTGRLVHIDFQRVDLDKEVELAVPIHASGASPIGVRGGGILEHVQRAITIRCKPLAMPQFIEVDLSNLDVHESIHVVDLKLPEGVTVMDSPDTALFAVVAPHVVVEAEVAVPGVEAEDAEAEPEVIARKKEDGAPEKGDKDKDKK
jgi:large subunit ribosomal protein L25